MSSSFQKPKDMKYTDMAIYIDAHASDLLPEGSHEDVEIKVYEYIYLICYALAFKAGYFGKNLMVYDDFALYMAANVYTILIKRQRDAAAGKEFHGTPIKPVKSVLNYIKATLYPCKVDYQQAYYREVLNPEQEVNTDLFKEKATDGIQKEYSGNLFESYDATLQELPAITNSVFKHTPFAKDSVLRAKLVNSVYLTLIDQITLPNHIKEKIAKKRKSSSQWELSIRFMKAHEALERPVRLWHLDPSYANYVNLLAMEIKKELSKRMGYYIHSSELSPELIDRVLDTAYTTYDQDVEE